MKKENTSSKRRNVLTRMLSWMLVCIMIFTAAPLDAFAATPIEVNTLAAQTVKVHFAKPQGWSGATVHHWGGTATSTSWPGNNVSMSEDYAGYYTWEAQYTSGTLQFLFSNNGGTQTTDLTLTSTQIASSKEWWIVPTGYNSENKITCKTSSSYVDFSPMVRGKDVTFVYEGSASSAQVYGTWSDWATPTAMTKSGSKFSTVLTLQPGVYEYKFVIGSTWMKDPKNMTTTDSDNSYLVVDGFTQGDGNSEVAKGGTVELPTSGLSYYTPSASTITTGTISYEVEDAFKQYATLDGNTLSVNADCAVKEIVLKATFKVGDVTYYTPYYVSVVEKQYTYVIYAHSAADNRNEIDGAELYFWGKSGTTSINAQSVAFTEKVTLADGREWLKATIKSAVADEIGFILKDKDSWEWQTADIITDNKTYAPSRSYYVVDGYNCVYSSPIGTPEDRHLYVEYVRSDENYKDTYAYVWNNGYTKDGSGANYPFEDKDGNGVYVAKIPVIVGKADKTIGLFAQKGTDFTSKDGGDNFITYKANADNMKVRFAYGKVMEHYPSNVGSKIDSKNNKLHFYYRDKVLFEGSALDSLAGKVSVVVRTKKDGTLSAAKTYAMTYDKNDDRYEYSLAIEKDTEYYYYYSVDGKKVTDAYNKKEEVISGIKYSVRKNKYVNINIGLSLSQSAMHYDQNNVLSVTVTPQTQNDDISDFVIEEAYVDLSELGLAKKVAINPELMKLTFGCEQSVVAGQKTITVTLVDDSGLEYTKTITVNVTERQKTEGTTEKLGDFDWDEAVIYFAVTDRFFDGDKTNNDGVAGGAEVEGDLSHPSGIHGGDFAGLTEKIDYLYDLGVNTIWITPIVDNIDGNLLEEDGDVSNAYHGYWTSDFTKLNPHLGTETEFEALVDAVHEKGMKIMVDVVLNHAGYGTEAYFNSILDKKMIRNAAVSNPNDYIQMSLSGLPDFLTEDEDVRNQLIEWQTTWMKEYEIDYYRVDTVKHVENTTWEAFKNALAEEDANFKLIGEYFDAGYKDDYDMLDSGKMDSVLDFHFNDLMMNLVNNDLSSIEKALVKRNGLLSNTATMGSFLSSHDEDGFLYALKLAENIDPTTAGYLMKLAATYQITAKGQPVIYYGEEIGLSGANTYPAQANRYDFNWSTQATQASSSSSFFAHYKKMLNIRREYSEIFAKGDRLAVIQNYLTDVEGNTISGSYDVFSRTYNNETIYVATSVASSSQSVKIYVKGSAGDTYVDKYNNRNYTVASDGSITITLPALSSGGTAVLVRQAGVVTPPTNNKQITVKLHYMRTDNSYTNWKLHTWADGLSGKDTTFVKGTNEAIATITIDGEKYSSLNYLIYKGDWEEKENNGMDASIDLSDIVSGTVHYYVNSFADKGEIGGSRVLGSDVVMGNKMSSVAYDRGLNAIVATMSKPIEGTLDNLFSVYVNALAKNVDVLGVEEQGNQYIIYLEELEFKNIMQGFKVACGDYSKTISFPLSSMYSSAEFEYEYTYTGDDLGATYTKDKTTFKVWAPTAEYVKVSVYESGTKGAGQRYGIYEMTQGEKGVWSYTLDGDWNGKYYTYTVKVDGVVSEVCDPYAVSTGVNGNRAMILDLDSTDPEGWEDDYGPHKDMDYTDAVIYELHIRDMTIDESSGVTSAHRGKYLGLTETGTTTPNGTPTGLDHMIDLGVTHVHLLPVYDYSSNSVDETNSSQKFNWGYDPQNYNVPEGSYSTDPYNGASRVSELKEMIQTLHENNINVIMDVVYNHVSDAGNFSVNKLVPKYFSRTNADGYYSNGSGCGNDTASERSMVHKYIVDSILYWHDEYHMDGFRFDLVGLLDTVTINRVVEEVHAIDPSIIFYGEGWTMGTDVTKPGYSMADQGNAWMTPGFAYFSDTFRDNIAGNNTNGQGFIWGFDNEDTMQWCFKGDTIWCPSPTQTINYASCHDNYTLMDKINIVSGANVKSYDTTPGDYQVKLNNLAAAFYMLSEGIPFIHAGEEFLRIKLDESGNVIHNSYNSPDSVNKIRWYQLDKAKYKTTSDYYKGLVEFRKNHAALRLTNDADVYNNVTYHWVTNDVILFNIKGSAPDEVSDGIIVIFNGSGYNQTVNLANYGASGTWNICIKDDKAGTSSLGTVSSGQVTVSAHSTMALVKGTLVDNNSVYKKNNRVSIKFKEATQVVALGDTKTLEVDVNPKNSTLKWTSSDTSVVKVDESGKLTPKSIGTATITVETLHGLKATCTVTVKQDDPAYSISYVLNGGTNSTTNPVTYKESSATITLADATRKGYTFGGWYSDEKLTTKVTTIAAGSAGNKTLYAKWTVNKYIIKFDKNSGASGTMANMTDVKYGTSYTLTANVYKRKGYTFAGWNTKADGSGTVYADKAKVKSLTATNGKTITLYAQWKKTKYTITYVLNSGKNSTKNPASFYVTTDTITLQNPTRTGYTFAGWYKDSAFKTKVTQIAKGSAASIKLYAKWTPKKYNIKFNANGGTGTMSSLSSRKYGTSYALPANKYTRKNYKFAGWNTKKDGKGTTYKDKASVKNLSATNGATVTLYAQWTPVTYKITYVLNGGKNNKKNTATYAIVSGLTLSSPTRKGYTFKGWYTDSKFKKKVTKIAAGSTGAKKFYAKWEKAKYTITYKLNSGKNNSKNPSTYYVTTSTITLKNPTRTGYTFKGWYSDSKFKKKVTKIAKGSAGNVTLYAKWVKTKYTITYKLVGGKNSSKNPAYYYITTSTITLKNPTRSGYVFQGWYTSSKYKTRVTKIKKGSTGNIALYAKWKKK